MAEDKSWRLQDLGITDDATDVEFFKAYKDYAAKRVEEGQTHITMSMTTLWFMLDYMTRKMEADS